MSSPKVRRKLSIPAFMNQSKSRKQGLYGNRLEVIDNFQTKSRAMYPRRISVDSSTSMHPISIILPNGTKQIVAIFSGSCLKDVLHEVIEELPLQITSYGFRSVEKDEPVSLTCSTQDYIGCQLKIVKTSKADRIHERGSISRLQLTKDLCASERIYNNRLLSAESTYQVPLKCWGIDEAELCLLFDGITKAKKISQRILEKFEKKILTWINEDSCVGDVFDETFWTFIDNYFTDFELAKRTLKHKKKADAGFKTFINMQKSMSGKPTLEALILTPNVAAVAVLLLIVAEDGLTIEEKNIIKQDKMVETSLRRKFSLTRSKILLAVPKNEDEKSPTSRRKRSFVSHSSVNKETSILRLRKCSHIVTPSFRKEEKPSLKRTLSLPYVSQKNALHVHTNVINRTSSELDIKIFATTELLSSKTTKLDRESIRKGFKKLKNVPMDVKSNKLGLSNGDNKTTVCTSENISTIESIIKHFPGTQIPSAKVKLGLTTSLPICLQRVAHYERLMTGISAATPTSHKDKACIEETVDRLHRWTERRGADLFNEETEFKIIQVQERFPHDKLDLDVTLDDHERLKYIRQNSPSMRHKKTNISGDVEIEHRKPNEYEKNGRASPASSGLTRRLFILDGPVKLSAATSTNDRYLFLFNDLLLVAKAKSASTFKLKERVRVSDMWLAACIDLVTEVTVPSERAFVMGWPTTNYVAAFSTVEEKEFWYKALLKSINERRDQEDKKEVTIKVCNRVNHEDLSSPQTASFPVNSKQDARQVIRMSLEQFQYQNEEANDYELWLKSKDMITPYPLIGHELPYTIKMSHSRVIYDLPNDENENQWDTPSASMKDDGTCQFILRKSKKGAGRVNFELTNLQKKWKKNPIKKSPIINWAMNKKSIKSPYTQLEALTPGKLFGNALTQLSTDEIIIPKPIQDILVQLFRRGPSTTGIFRKSANQRVAKQVRLSLDQGNDVNLEEKSAVVLATVMKDFCRGLPESLLTSDLYESLLATRSVADCETRVQQIKRILQQLPKEHYEVTMKFMNVLYHIQRFSDINNMNSYNLSICVSPSVMWSTNPSKLSVTEQASGSSDVVCFIIENYLSIFSVDSEYVLGEEADIQFNDGAGEDSDSGTDQIVYKCTQPSEDEEDTRVEEYKVKPTTPDFIFTDEPCITDSIFTQSDSSLGTNGSDDIKSVSAVNNPIISLTPETNYVSKSSPSSPLGARKKEMLAIEMLAEAKTKHLSDISDQEEHTEHFQRKLLKHQRNKRILSSTTTSAELIEHKTVYIDTPESSPNSDIKSTIDNSDSSQLKENESKRYAKKSIISQPIQHFATEFFQTPSYVFLAVDRRLRPAAPSYEEHIQRTQSKHRVIQSTTVKQPIISNASLVKKQSVDEYQPLRHFVHAMSFPDIIETVIPSDANNEANENLTFKTSHPLSLPKADDSTALVNANDDGFADLQNTTLENTELSNSKAIDSHILESNCIDSDRQDIKRTMDETFDSIFETITQNILPDTKTIVPPTSASVTTLHLDDMKYEKNQPRPCCPTDKNNITKNILPTAPKPNRSNTNGSRSLSNDLKDSDFSPNSTSSGTFSDFTVETKDNECLLKPESREMILPRSNNPFTLLMKSECKKNASSNCNVLPAHSSLHVEKTSLTKAPLKLEQLRHSTPKDPTRIMTAREMRKTNKRLKSEIRSAFNDGFVYKSSEAFLTSENLKNKKFTLNSHIGGSAFIQVNLNKMKILEKHNNQHSKEKRTQDLLEVSKVRYSERHHNNDSNNNTSDHSPGHEKSLSSEESYV